MRYVRALCNLRAVALLDFLAVCPLSWYVCLWPSCYIGLSPRVAFHLSLWMRPLTCFWPSFSRIGCSFPSLWAFVLAPCWHPWNESDTCRVVAGVRAFVCCCLRWKKWGQHCFQCCLGLPTNVCTVALLVGLAALQIFFLPLPSLGLWKLTALLHMIFGEPRLLACYQGYKGKAYRRCIVYWLLFLFLYWLLLLTICHRFPAPSCPLAAALLWLPRGHSLHG